MVESKDDKLDALFHALAHRTRRGILMLLVTRPHHLSEFTSIFDISLTAISRHVQVLNEAGLVQRKFVGRNHICSLDVVALDVLFTWSKGLTRQGPSSSAESDKLDHARPKQVARLRTR
ncbi:ArsR/SmtB family transcription factor [Hyphomicrobium sp.]|uniref:ArsR/SmtB family transcription factor n=1 Tax=Hyphomicrobium sp. TaxID=82 RepID=UPI002FE28B37